MSKNNNGAGKGGGQEPWNRIDPSAASDGDIQRVHEELVHDKETPKEGFSPIPIFLVFLISGLIVFSGIYMVWSSDDFDQMGYDETRRRFPWVATEATVAVDPVLQAGRRVYTQCAACHQQDGRGLPGAFPSLVGTRWVGGSEDRLIRLVLHGLIGPIEVEGVAYNGVMPAFGAQLSDEEVASVLSYIRQAWANDAGPILASDVAQVRQTVGPRGPWDSIELLQQYPLEDPAELEDVVEDPEQIEEAAEAEQPE